MTTFQLLDVIALLEDIPEEGLRRGHIGTLVEELAPDVWEVEFVDSDGQTYALASLKESQMMKLIREPASSHR